MKCKSCGGSIPAKSTICEYCGVHNDIDLRGVHEYTVHIPESDRICPTCNIKLKTIDLNIEGSFYIEQCDQCFGLFFDPGELESLLEASVKKKYRIDFKKLNNIEKNFKLDDKIIYRKCPICQEFMNRKNFGTRSGVIIDICSDHGIWLNGGELRKLMEWKNAGGMLLHEQRVEENRIRREKEQKARDTKMREYRKSTNSTGNYNFGTSSFYNKSDDDLLSSIGNMIFKLFV